MRHENGSTTIESYGVKFEVDYTYTPGEKQVMYYPNGDGYPGSPPEIEINSLNVQYSEQEVYDIVARAVLEDIQEQILESYE
tara:strand:- start:350 stop:595 length:246 start_codon:yes stop_codon:yes gene_type:complete